MAKPGGEKAGVGPEFGMRGEFRGFDQPAALAAKFPPYDSGGMGTCGPYPFPLWNEISARRRQPFNVWLEPGWRSSVFVWSDIWLRALRAAAWSTWAERSGRFRKAAPAAH